MGKFSITNLLHLKQFVLANYSISVWSGFDVKVMILGKLFSSCFNLFLIYPYIFRSLESIFNKYRDLCIEFLFLDNSH